MLFYSGNQTLDIHMYKNMHGERGLLLHGKRLEARFNILSHLASSYPDLVDPCDHIEQLQVNIPIPFIRY